MLKNLFLKCPAFLLKVLLFLRKCPAFIINHLVILATSYTEKFITGKAMMITWINEVIKP